VKRLMKYNYHISCTCISERNITKLVYVAESFGLVIRIRTAYSGCLKADSLDHVFVVFIRPFIPVFVQYLQMAQDCVAIALHFEAT
jgi:hypothetical protein